jgi:hypothetical protein
MKSTKLFVPVLGSLIILAISLPLPVMAQSNTQSSSTIEGCLDGAIENYTLTDRAGATYKLIGNAEQLKIHVGETIRVTGVVTPVAHFPGAMSEGVRTQPTLSVISLHQVSGVCHEANDIP